MESKGHRKLRTDDTWREEFSCFYIHGAAGDGAGKEEQGEEEVEGGGEGEEGHESFDEQETGDIAEELSKLAFTADPQEFSEPLKEASNAGAGRDRQKNARDGKVPSREKNVMKLDALREKYQVGSWAGRARLAKLERMREDPRLQVKAAQWRGKAETLQQVHEHIPSYWP